MISRPCFTLEDADRAHSLWGANCGPAALAAVTGQHIENIRAHIPHFIERGYTSPNMMYAALRSIGVLWCRTDVGWPTYGLARIQWEGPWSDAGMPLRARYRHTHWIGVARGHESTGIFDINCLNNGTGWCSRSDWEATVVPYLIALHPESTGKWHITHTIEVQEIG